MEAVFLLPHSHSNAAADFPYLISSRTHNMIVDTGGDKISLLEYFFPGTFLPKTKIPRCHVPLSLQAH